MSDDDAETYRASMTLLIAGLVALIAALVIVGLAVTS